MIFRAIRNFLNKRKSSQCRIVVSELGAKLNGIDDFNVSFDWSEVREIATYKDDLLTTDLICVEFKLADDKVYLTHEEAEGFL